MKLLFTSLITILLSAGAFAQNDTILKNKTKMKVNAGIITTKLAETKKFYTEALGFGVTFENDTHNL